MCQLQVPWILEAQFHPIWSFWRCMLVNSGKWFNFGLKDLSEVRRIQTYWVLNIESEGFWVAMFCFGLCVSMRDIIWGSFFFCMNPRRSFVGSYTDSSTFKHFPQVSWQQLSWCKWTRWRCPPMTKAGLYPLICLSLFVVAFARLLGNHLRSCLKSCTFEEPFVIRCFR